MGELMPVLESDKYKWPYLNEIQTPDYPSNETSTLIQVIQDM